MFSKLIILLILGCSPFCYGESSIHPTKYYDLEKIYLMGEPIFLSKKNNSVLMYQTGKKIKYHKANFYFALFNQSEKPINFLFTNLKVTDQKGRPVKVLHKNAIIEGKRKRKSLELLCSAIIAGLDDFNVSQAGRVNAFSEANTSYFSNTSSYTSQGYMRNESSTYMTTNTTTTFYSDALQRQAERQVQIDYQNRVVAINRGFESFCYGMHRYYFDSHTVFPGRLYAANFQIYISKEMEEELEYLFFTYEVDGEEHCFCYYVL